MRATEPNYPFYRLAAGITVFLIALAVVMLTVYGKTGSFLLINDAHNNYLDRVMPWLTYLGDGMIYIPILLISFLFRRDYLLAIVAGIIITFLFTHVLKDWIFPEMYRPYILESQGHAIHKVAGVELNTIHSFPSGHTSTAFTMALLLAALMKQRVWVIMLPIAALLVGYSRIYLAQHYLTDVTGGMAIGLLSSAFSLVIYRAALRWNSRRKTTT
jgi:membrane-associated phospholipid phosphatase